MMTIGIPTGCTAAWRVDNTTVAVNPLYRGLLRIGIERERQIRNLGYSVERDGSENKNSELSLAAACYALPAPYRDKTNIMRFWPWDYSYWKPDHKCPESPSAAINGRIRELEKAGALIAAEIDRLLSFIA